MPWICDVNPEESEELGEQRYVEVFTTRREAVLRGIAEWRDWAQTLTDEAEDCVGQYDDEEIAESAAEEMRYRGAECGQIASAWQLHLDEEPGEVKPLAVAVSDAYDVRVYRVTTVDEIEGLDRVREQENYADHRAAPPSPSPVVGLTERMTGQRRLVSPTG